MKTQLLTPLLILAAVVSAVPAWGQLPREDTIWARTIPTPLNLDGVLNEAAWAGAESIRVQYAQDSGIPGSGWKSEGGVLPGNPTNATLKFLVHNDQFYVGAIIRDQSVGGSRDFNRFDGMLMALKDHLDPAAPKPPSEYFYAWWYPTLTDPQPPGQSPAFIGRWAPWPPGSPRTPEQIQNWDARTVVHGLSNSDATVDTDYVVEMRFDLSAMGYDVTRPEGDTIEWNISLYDCDWFWPLDPVRFSSNRVWWQSPWGNTGWYNEVRVMARPSVNLFSGPVPSVGPELLVPHAETFATPTIDGDLTEPVWVYAPRFDIRYGDDALRASYPGVSRYRAGQYQPEVNGGFAQVLDPADATVKYFYKGDILYLAFEVRDQVVQFHANFDRWDGVLVTPDEYEDRGPDNQLIGRRLSFQVGANGEAIAHDYLATLIAEGGASVAMNLMPGTVVDTLGQTADTGYRAEMAIDLTHLGYPAGLGDRRIFFGINLLDGDSFTPYTDSYGTRTWWWREYEGTCCVPWGHLDPDLSVTAIEETAIGSPSRAAVRNHPNPGGSTTISYDLAEEARAALDVFDVQGRLVARQDLGLQAAGKQDTFFNGTNLESGLYFYRLRFLDPATGQTRTILSGKMTLTR
jgi:hypothetical protein